MSNGNPWTYLAISSRLLGKRMWTTYVHTLWRIKADIPYPFPPDISSHFLQHLPDNQSIPEEYGR
jgi:hypothetical protein